MARMTTSRSAAAMRTAAVGDSPKIVVRSETAERGRAELPSSRRSSLFVVVVLTLPEALPPGVLSVPDALPLAPPAGAGVLTLPDDELGPDCTWGAGTEVELDDDDWASTSDTGAANSATPSRAANKAFITAPPLRGRSKASATERIEAGRSCGHEHLGDAARALQRRDLVRRSQRRRRTGRGTRVSLRRPRPDVCGRPRARQSYRQRTARARCADGGPRARALSGHAGVPRRLLGGDQDRS